MQTATAEKGVRVTNESMFPAPRAKTEKVIRQTNTLLRCVSTEDEKRAVLQIVMHDDKSFEVRPHADNEDPRLQGVFNASYGVDMLARFGTVLELYLVPNSMLLTVHLMGVDERSAQCIKCYVDMASMIRQLTDAITQAQA